MIINILYPEVGRLNGDLSNITYISKCTKTTIIETHLNEEPYFVNHKVDLIYMGSMTEDNQDLVIEKLKKYKEKIKELIKNNTFFLITGNALEIFGKYIENEDGSKIEGLNIFDYYSKRDFTSHFAAHVVGTYKDITIVGDKSQFSHTYGIKDKFIDVIRGKGSDNEGNIEGIKKNNFYATYLIGPFLIQNPLFVKYLLESMKVKFELAFESTIMKSYEIRKTDLLDERMKY